MISWHIDKKHRWSGAGRKDLIRERPGRQLLRKRPGQHFRANSPVGLLDGTPRKRCESRGEKVKVERVLVERVFMFRAMGRNVSPDLGAQWCLCILANIIQSWSQSQGADHVAHDVAGIFSGIYSCTSGIAFSRLLCTDPVSSSSGSEENRQQMVLARLRHSGARRFLAIGQQDAEVHSPESAWP